MITKLQPLTIHIKPERLVDFKETILKVHHSDFIKTNEGTLNIISAMKDICKEDVDFLLHRLKEKYQPIQVKEEMEVQYSITYRSYESQDDLIELLIYINNELIFDYCFIKDHPTELKYFTEETVNQIMAIVNYAFECAEQQRKRADLEANLDSSLEQVKPPELRSKIKSLIKSLK